MLGDLPSHNDDRVLIDYRTSDDAGVYRIGSDRALVQTVDFFTPIVDDPFVFGQIAAANALSDVYAMGGRPLTALAIAAFPKDAERDILRSIFTGGLDKLREAGVALLGGHTVQDSEIKFGYAITGEVDPSRVLANGGAVPGDALLLTKPIGTGIISTALKFGRAPQLGDRCGDALDVDPESRRGRDPRESRCGVGACVHGHHGLRPDRARVGNGRGQRVLARNRSRRGCRFSRARASSYGATFRVAAEPTGNISPPARASAPHVDETIVDLLYDPQTSGGLLVAAPDVRADQLLKELLAAGVPAARIGRVVPGGGAAILVV